jgi:Family of unknown function (DUF6152)
MRTRYVAAAMLIVDVLLAGTVRAHHSPAAYDRSKEVRYEGTVTKYAFNNPHIYLTIEMRGPDGRLVSQEVEAGPISTIQPLGLQRDSLRVGDRVVVRGNPSRRGDGHTMLGLDVARLDGTVLPLNIESTSVRPPSTALATSIEGVWLPSVADFGALGRVVATAWPLTERGRRELEEARRVNSTTHSDCVPAGAPMLMVYPVASSVKVDAETVVFDIDWLDAQRVIRIGAAHPTNLEPSLQGHSIGHWEGGALVVDTRGFASHTEGIGFGMPSSEEKHLIERFSLEPDRRHLRYEVTVEDPAYLTEPSHHTARWEYAPDLPPSGVKCDREVAQQYLREAAAR